MIRGCTTLIMQRKYSGHNLSVIYNNRAIAYRYKGDLDHAIADYNRALDLDPKNWSAVFSRGHLEVLTGALPAAVADLTRASELLPKNLYSALWLEIAARRGNANSRLAEATRQLEMGYWPSPVIRLYLGEMTPEALLAAADNIDAEVRATQLCEANFYTGEFYLRQGKKDDAMRLFRSVTATCQKTLINYESARAELKTLAP